MTLIAVLEPWAWWWADPKILAEKPELHDYGEALEKRDIELVIEIVRYTQRELDPSNDLDLSEEDNTAWVCRDLKEKKLPIVKDWLSTVGQIPNVSAVSSVGMLLGDGRHRLWRSRELGFALIPVQCAILTDLLNVRYEDCAYARCAGHDLTLLSKWWRSQPSDICQPNRIHIANVSRALSWVNTFL